MIEAVPEEADPPSPVNLDQLLAHLPMQVDTWDVQVKALPGFGKDSPAHQALFLYGRRPFKTGSKDARIQAVETLGITMNGHPALVMVTAMVNVCHGLLLNARSNQTRAIGETKFKSNAVEQSRVEVMTEQYRDLGFLMDKQADNPKAIASFFDLNALRQSDQTCYTGTLDRRGRRRSSSTPLWKMTA